MIAICITIYLLLGFAFIASLAFAASRPVPQASDASSMPIAEAQFKTDEEAALRKAA